MVRPSYSFYLTPPHRLAIVNSCHPPISLSAIENLSTAPVGTHVDDPIFHYVITRRDLPAGIREAQLIHACGGSARLASEWSDEIYSGALWVRDEAALRALTAVLSHNDVPHIATVENSGELAGQLTAIGIAPAPKSKLKRYLSSIPRIK